MQCSQSISRRSSSQRSENSATSYSFTLSIIECGRSVTIFGVPYPSGIRPQRSSPVIPLSRRGLSGCQASLRTRNGATAHVIAWIFCIGRRTARSPKQQDLSILPCYTSMLPELSSSPHSAKFVLWRPHWPWARFAGAIISKPLSGITYYAGSNTTSTKLVLRSYMQAQLCGT
jgi:hypothetical protein